MKSWLDPAGPVGMDWAISPDLEMPLALFGSQEDEAQHDANDDNQGDLLPCLLAIC